MKSISINRFPSLSYASEEAFNTLCTNLTFSGANVKIIMVTSCHSSEGKSFTSMNICRTLAGFGKNAVLIDADLRRSMVAKDYQFSYSEPDQAKGMTHYLAGLAEESEVLYSTNVPGMWVVPAGRLVSNSLSLLNSPRLPQFLRQLSIDFDYVIVDAPPIGALIDAAEIAKSCDGTLMVLRYNQVRKKELVACYQQLRATNCQMLGTVMNMTELGSYMNRKYYYKNYYYYKGYYKGGYYNSYYYGAANEEQETK